MPDLLPWLAVAGLGALHGLNPSTGWMFATACGLRAHGGAGARRALLPIAVGHVASIAVVAWAVAEGMAPDRSMVQTLAGALLVATALLRGLRRAEPARDRLGASHAGIAFWSFLMASAHGSGLMLVPALVPMCLADNPARGITASGSMGLALAAVGVHTVAMLAVTGLVAGSLCKGLAARPRLLDGAAARQAWAAALALTGLALIALH